MSWHLCGRLAGAGRDARRASAVGDQGDQQRSAEPTPVDAVVGDLGSAQAHNLGEVNLVTVVGVCPGLLPHQGLAVEVVAAGAMPANQAVGPVVGSALKERPDLLPAGEYSVAWSRIRGISGLFRTASGVYRTSSASMSWARVRASHSWWMNAASASVAVEVVRFVSMDFEPMPITLRPRTKRSCLMLDR